MRYARPSRADRRHSPEKRAASPRPTGSFDPAGANAFPANQMFVLSAAPIQTHEKLDMHVTKGQWLGEIVNIEDHTAPRIPIEAHCNGFVYGMELQKLAIPGEIIIIYAAGKEPLEWRKGYLLTAK
eukprot:gene12937-9250_t